ncbi:MAG: thiamine pyrophosphate-dependent enzyme [Vampirovibrionales bacterium]|nr:thiamine pyrophosphate-dependent enzyme [Vampirovibrionales bacterium]
MHPSHAFQGFYPNPNLGNAALPDDDASQYAARMSAQAEAVYALGMSAVGTPYGMPYGAGFNAAGVQAHSAHQAQSADFWPWQPASAIPPCADLFNAAPSGSSDSGLERLDATTPVDTAETTATAGARGKAEGSSVPPETSPMNPDKPFGLEKSALQTMYRQMVTLRLFDERARRLQRTGKIGFCVTARGEEATQIGVSAALKASDWVMPSYRQHGIAYCRGVSLERLMHHLFGNALDGCQGKPMPAHASFKDINYVGISSVIGTQIIHGVGVAHAARLKGEDTVCATFFGDGATSANDFHSALNFAGVLQAPVIFCCVNNQYAISLPAAKQTAAKTMAQKAVAYGIPGFRVDGTDVLAVYQAMRDAVERARSGLGPTLLEFYTYRFDPHSSSDDPTRYRSQDETDAWQGRDPIDRFKHQLAQWGFWTDDDEQVLQQSAADAVMAASKAAEAAPNAQWRSVFEDVYAQVPAQLEAQYEALMRREAGLTLEHAGAFPL